MVITITGRKGGIGKTTTAVHLAAYFQTLGSTLLVDGDPNDSALIWANRESFPFKTIDSSVVQTHLQEQQYDYVIVDTKAHPEPEDIQVLAENCDLLVLPSRPSFLDLHALLQTVQTLEQLQAPYKVLLTMVRPPKRTDKHTKRMTAREFLYQEKIPVFETEIQQLAVFEEAPDHGALVQDFGGAIAQKAWLSYQALGQEIKQEIEWREYNVKRVHSRG